MLNRLIKPILILLLLADICFSYFQFLGTPLDGDIAGGVLPANDVQKIFNDPFALSVITENAVYPNPNRFFAHWMFYEYFNTVPIILQNIVPPIESIYLSCAIAKSLIQILFLGLFGMLIVGHKKNFNKNFLLAALLITPLFQTNGYRSYMGIIDPSITYTFFYALPCVFLLVFYTPYLMNLIHDESFTRNKVVLITLGILAFCLPLSGPLIPGIVLVVSVLFLFASLFISYHNKKNLVFYARITEVFNRIPAIYRFYFILITFLSVYSLFIGTNNSIFYGNDLSVLKRFLRLPLGLYSILTGKIGYLLLIGVIIINLILIKKTTDFHERKKISLLMKLIMLFCTLYILLLPLGGYKTYRPNIIRYDTIIPVTLCLFFIYGISFHFLLQKLQGKTKIIYIFSIIVVSLIFTFADKPELEKNKCERMAITQIVKSKEKITFLNQECSIISWGKIQNPSESYLNSQLLKRWKITTEEKLYYQK